MKVPDLRMHGAGVPSSAYHAGSSAADGLMSSVYPAQTGGRASR